MNKSELVAAIASDANLSKKSAEEALNSFMGNVKTSLKKGDSVVLTGFGTFSVSKRAARNGRNPQTGATIKIPACKVPKFKAGKGLKEVVR
ncbi:HU family DNA-binding protein [Patescibacteria group bacterium]|nr:HU family DNA-binding protein [Patescibacteria group bacterium]